IGRISIKRIKRYKTTPAACPLAKFRWRPYYHTATLTTDAAGIWVYDRCAIVVRPATALVIVLMSTVMELSHSVKANEALSLPKRL
ncbi:hypothetical protein MSG28_002550, partial [Choristoneura fumiferana]